MSGEEQERFEDYLELETYIEELQAGHVAHPPKELTSVQARIYLMAVLFHSTSPEGKRIATSICGCVTACSRTRAATDSEKTMSSLLPPSQLATKIEHGNLYVLVPLSKP